MRSFQNFQLILKKIFIGILTNFGENSDNFVNINR